MQISSSLVRSSWNEKGHLFPVGGFKHLKPGCLFVLFPCRRKKQRGLPLRLKSSMARVSSNNGKSTFLARIVSLKCLESASQLHVTASFCPIQIKASGAPIHATNSQKRAVDHLCWILYIYIYIFVYIYIYISVCVVVFGYGPRPMVWGVNGPPVPWIDYIHKKCTM